MALEYGKAPILMPFFIIEVSQVVKYGLKAQKLLAQGIALGIIAINKAPCKGKSFVNCLILLKLLPFQGVWSSLAKLESHKKKE